MVWAAIGAWLESAIFVFSAPKRVLIRDLRLGVLLRCLQLAVVGYTLYDVLTKGSYLVIEVPNGIVTPRGLEPTAFKTLDLDTALNYPYCKNGRDYWMVKDEDKYTYIRCMYQRGGLWRRYGDGISYSTMMMEDKLWYVRAPSARDCDKNGSRYLKDATYNTVRYAVGSCVYRRTRNWFPVGVDMLNMSFWHSFTTSRVGATGSLPATVIRRKGSTANLHVFPKGTQPNLPLSKWLEYAGVDLDKRLDEQPIVVEGLRAKQQKNIPLINDQAAPVNNTGQLQDTIQGNITDDSGEATQQTDYPYARITGVQLVVNLQYFNYNLEPGSDQAQAKTQRGEVLAVAELAPVLTYAGTPSNLYYLMNELEQPDFLVLEEAKRATRARPPNDTSVDFSTTDIHSNGVVFRFMVSGAMGMFSFSNLLTIFTRMAVLMLVAHTITLYVAMWFLGTVSTMYNEFIMEKVSYRKEYARFAAQAIVAGFLFINMDKDGTGQLDGGEMLHSLQRVLGATLSEEELKYLTDFLLRHSDEDDKTNKKAVDEGHDITKNKSTISLSEWVDIFTEDKATVTSLKRILAHEYRKVASKEQEQEGENEHVVKDTEAGDTGANGHDPANGQHAQHAQHGAGADNRK